MSLINDALKKAQSQRSDEPAGATTPAADGTARISRRGRAQNANTMVLLGSGALVLVVLSVVVTVFLLNRQTPSANPAPKVAPIPPTAPGAADPSPAPVTQGEATPPAPTIGVPAISVPIGSAPDGNAPVPLAPEPAIATTAAVTPPPTVPPAATALPPPDAISDERVASFVDAIRVTGIRSFGTESRVLMNERVFRVNDIVERTLGVRLTEVKAESLTFTDANGKMYVKNF